MSLNYNLIQGNINNENLISHLSVIEAHPLLSSDHYIVCFDIPLNSSLCKRQTNTVVFDYTRADYNGLCDFLLESDFSHCLLSGSTEQVWSFLKHTILRAIYALVHPKSESQIQESSRHAIKCLRTTRKRCASRPTPTNLSKRHSLESKLHQLMTNAKLRFEQNLSMQSSSKIFKYIKSLSSSAPCLLLSPLTLLLLLTTIKRSLCSTLSFTQFSLRAHSRFLL